MARTKSVARQSTGGIAPVIKKSLPPAKKPGRDRDTPPPATNKRVEKYIPYSITISDEKKFRKELVEAIIQLHGDGDDHSENELDETIQKIIEKMSEPSEIETFPTPIDEEPGESKKSKGDVPPKKSVAKSTTKAVKGNEKTAKAKDALPGPEAFSVAQLKTILKQKGVKFDAKAKKADLLALLQSSGDVADRKKAAPGKSNVQKVVTKACLREKDYESFLKGATVAELKQDLKEYGVEVTGKKDLLIARCMYCAGLSDTDPDQ